jgi:hypothetical protein
VDIDNLVWALEKTLLFLQESDSSFWSSLSVQEIIYELESELDKAKNLQQVDLKRLGFLFAPTGVLQETAIDNNWALQYLELSKIIDNYTNEK